MGGCCPLNVVAEVILDHRASSRCRTVSMNHILRVQDWGVMGRKQFGFSDDMESIEKKRTVREDSTLMLGAAAQPHAQCAHCRRS